MHFISSTLLALATSLLSSINGAAASPISERAAGGLLLPENLPEGHYRGDGTIDPATGFARYTYEGPIDWDAVAEFTAARLDTETATTASSPLLQKRGGPVCSGHSAGNSVRTVIDAFPQHWGGQYLDGNHWVKTYAGTSMAYGCNYGNRQVIDGNKFLVDMGSVDGRCGGSEAGWFDHRDDSYNLNFGRDDINARFCW